jgi:hypothetical protein
VSVTLLPSNCRALGKWFSLLSNADFCHGDTSQATATICGVLENIPRSVRATVAEKINVPRRERNISALRNFTEVRRSTFSGGRG